MKKTENLSYYCSTKMVYGLICTDIRFYMSSAANISYLISFLSLISVAAAPLKTTRVNTAHVDGQQQQQQLQQLWNCETLLISNTLSHHALFFNSPSALGDRGDRAGPEDRGTESGSVSRVKSETKSGIMFDKYLKKRTFFRFINRLVSAVTALYCDDL